MTDQPRSFARIDGLAAAILLGSVLWFIVGSVRWPMTGDASILRYVNLLLAHGWAPYREIADINLPGAYALDWIVLHTLGPGDLAWRAYDFALLALAAFAMHRITHPSGWFAGLWAWSLFALIHGRDGLIQAGQRDLAVAVLLLWGAVALLGNPVTSGPIRVFLFGLAVGAATTVKPSAVVFILLVVPVLLPRCRSGMSISRLLFAALLGLLLPVLAATLWLIHQNALAAFLRTTWTLIRFHATLGRQSLPYLFEHSFAPIVPLVALWVAILLWSRLARPALSQAEAHPSDLTRQILLLASLLGLVGYLVQVKGYPYHRYSFLAFLLPLIAMDLSSLSRYRRSYSIPAFAVLYGSALLLAPAFVWRIGRYDWRNQGYRLTLQADLLSAQRNLGLPTLSGRVQCLDTAAGCLEALLRAHLLPSTGTLYDEFLFEPHGNLLSPSDLANPPLSSATGQSRQAFLEAIAANPPEVLVVTSPLFPSGPDDFAKLVRWPGFDLWITTHYTLSLDRPALPPARWGSPPVAHPGYRLYLRNRQQRRPPPG